MNADHPPAPYYLQPLYSHLDTTSAPTSAAVSRVPPTQLQGRTSSDSCVSTDESAQRDWESYVPSTMSSPPTPKRLKTSSIPANAQNHLLAQQQQQQQQQQLHPFQPVPPFEGMHMPPPQVPPPNPRKRRSSHQPVTAPTMAAPVSSASTGEIAQDQSAGKSEPPRKKGRTNTPWTAEEEQRLKTMRDAGRSWSEIAKTFPARTEGSVKKHWYKDMHYAEFAEDESQALREAIKEYEANKWKVIGQKVGKPAKACEQYAKEHFKDL